MQRAMPVTSPETEAALNQLGMSAESQPLFDAVKRHIAQNVEPIAEEFYRLGEGRTDRWSWAPGQLELLETAKNKAKASGLWNFFLPESEIGRGLTNLDYAYIAAELGKQPGNPARVATFAWRHRSRAGPGRPLRGGPRPLDPAQPEAATQGIRR